MSNEHSEDLSANAAQNFEISSSPSTRVDLDQQQYHQRQWIFGIVLVVAFLMYVAVGTFLFCSHFFRILIISQPFSISIVIALLVIPSMLLWSLVAAVYKQDSSKDDSIFSKDGMFSKFLQELTRYIQRKV